ncbi:hypothetical protein [Lentimicrobium sp. S6]|uniref:hypothetical protein n=1 Tax=Lentimicrobium sp. S6 TaxID=2735872 RepID=UPI00155282AE|nr:hypothetical protein [Lentimicrobium sp. S6]NPD48281.1 hypothetical protein [Lentimicrobium sp. S6]
MKIFDYIYYRVFFTYKNKWKDDTPGAYATSLVTLMQSMLFIMTPYFSYELITNTKIEITKISILIGFIILFFLNLYRYQKVINFKSLSEKWDNEDKTIRKRKGIFTIVIIVLVVGGTLTLATIGGKINTGKMKPLFLN